MRIEGSKQVEHLGAVRIHDVRRLLELDSGARVPTLLQEGVYSQRIERDKITAIQQRLAIVLPIKDEDVKVFEGGATGFTKRAFRYKPSNKRNLSAEVFTSDNHEYMKFMIEGGTRFPDKRAIRVSTKHSKLNKYGNFTRATVQKMINDKKKYFTGVPKGMPGAGAGVWERYGRKTKSGGQKIRMVGVFQDNAQYRPLFPFGEFTEGVVFSRNDGFAIKFRQRLEEAIKTSK